MGMGEPLQNYAALVPALRAMLDDHGYGLSRRRVTVSTSGMVAMIDRLREDCPVALAVSLHAPNDALRNDLVPLNRKDGIDALLAACVRYLPAAPRDFVIATASCNYVPDPPFEVTKDSFGAGFEIFDTVAELRPDLMLWLGDNIYGADSVPDMANKFATPYKPLLLSLIHISEPTRPY